MSIYNVFLETVESLFNEFKSDWCVTGKLSILLYLKFTGMEEKYEINPESINIIGCKSNSVRPDTIGNFKFEENDNGSYIYLNEDNIKLTLCFLENIPHVNIDISLFSKNKKHNCNILLIEHNYLLSQYEKHEESHKALQRIISYFTYSPKRRKTIKFSQNGETDSDNSEIEFLREIQRFI